jgi:hypothetical protein
MALMIIAASRIAQVLRVDLLIGRRNHHWHFIFL